MKKKAKKKSPQGYMVPRSWAAVQPKALAKADQRRRALDTQLRETLPDLVRAATAALGAYAAAVKLREESWLRLSEQAEELMAGLRPMLAVHGGRVTRLPPKPPTKPKDKA